MKGKIDKDGILWIERPGKIWVRCKCKTGGLASNNSHGTCSHYCGRFGDPQAEVADKSTRPDDAGVSQGYYPNVPTGRTVLHICEGTVLVFDEFTDERVAK